MVPTMNLPEGMRVSDLSARLQCALEELDSIEPTRYALAHWMTGAYRATLEGGGGQRWPFVLPLPTEIASMLDEAKAAVARAREAARSLDGRIVDALPDRVHVVRVKDASGATGFAPIDVKHATLKERVLSVLLADYLMHPEAYVAEARAPEVTLPEVDVSP